MVKSAERAGKPDVAALVRAGRLKYNATRGLDPNPNPPVGRVMNPDSGMRAGLTPEKYHRLVLLSERRRRMRKEWDFVPTLEDHEWDIYIKWLKSGGPKKMRATGKDVAHGQVRDAMELLRKYDPQSAANLENIPSNPYAESREVIGETKGGDETEGDAEEEAEETVEETEEASQVVPEGEVPEGAPEGYTAVDADAEETEPAVVSPRRRRRSSK